MNVNLIAILLLLFFSQVNYAQTNDARVKAYLNLQKPYRECVKAAMSKRYNTIVESCMKQGQALALIENCQSIAEKKTNDEAKDPVFSAHCLTLKPTKEDFDKHLDALQNVESQ